MTLMIAGIVLWVGVHLIPATAPDLKSLLQARLGAAGYKGLFALSILSALALIVLGWRSSSPVLVYAPLVGLKPLALGLNIIAFVLMGATGRPSRIGRVVRHPQLTGLLVWALAHLMLNGDSRSLLLFASLGLWAMLEIILISRRDGAWVKPPAPSWATEGLGLVVTAAVIAGVIYVHPWIAGMPVF